MRQIPPGGAPPPRAVAVLERLERQEPNNALALFYLGAASFGHPRQIEFLKESSAGYLILGCMGVSEAYALPISFVESLLKDLNKTESVERPYWHLMVQPDGMKRVINLSKVGQKIDLAPYAFALTPVST